MMAAMLHPDRRVLAVCGDGGFMMNSQELETAVRLKLNLVVLILDDNGYGMIRWKQAVDHFPDWGLTFGNPDFVKYAEAYGAKGSRVEATEDLVPTLEAAFAGGGVHLVTVPIDYSENMRVLVDELKNRVPAAARRRQGAARMTEIEVRAPYDGQLIRTVATSGAEDVEAALATAYGLFRDRDGWLAPAARIEILRETARLMQQQAEDLAREAAHEGGKPLVDSRVEVARAIDGVLHCAELLRSEAGHVVPMGLNGASAGRIAFTQHEPIGVVVAVSAFNHPLNLIVHQVAPGHRGRLPGHRQAGHRHAAVLLCASRHSCARPACRRPGARPLVIESRGAEPAAGDRPARRLLQLHRQRRGRLAAALAAGARRALRPGAWRCRTGDRRRRRRSRPGGAGACQGRLLPCRAGLRVGAAGVRAPVDRGRARGRLAERAASCGSAIRCWPRPKSGR